MSELLSWVKSHKIVGYFNPRGGIKTVVKSSSKKNFLVIIFESIKFRDFIEDYYENYCTYK